MAEVNQIYEIALYPAEWNLVVKKYQDNLNVGAGTLLERDIDGKKVRCEVIGYSWDATKKPAAPLKQRIKVQVTEVLSN